MIGGRVMREFEFAPADVCMPLDAVENHSPSLWTRQDVMDAIVAHAKYFDHSRTRAVVYEITGVTNIVEMPGRHFGALIARLATEMSNRPHKVLA